MANAFEQIGINATKRCHCVQNFIRNPGGALHFCPFFTVRELFWLVWPVVGGGVDFFCKKMANSFEPFGMRATKRYHCVQNPPRVLIFFVFKHPFSTRKKLWPTWWPMWGPTGVQSGGQKVVVTFQPLGMGPQKQKKMGSPGKSTQVRHPTMGQIPTPSQLLAHWAEPHYQSGTMPLGHPPKPGAGSQISFLLLGMRKNGSDPVDPP